MNTTPNHVIVVGAGMVGLATAWHLQEAGVEVTVIERSCVAGGSSWGNAGWLAPALTLPLPEPAVLASGIKAALDPASPVYVPFTLNPRLLRFLVGFARHCTPSKWHRAMIVYGEVNKLGLEAFAELNDKGVGEHTQLADPFLAAFSSDTDREALVTEFGHVVDAGGETKFERVSGDEMRELEPTLGAGVTSGILLHGQRFINPGRFVHSLADAVRARGGKILEGVTVDDIDELPSGGVDVVTTHERFRCDAVVVATGTWLGHLTRKFGVKTIVQAGRGYSFTVQPEQMPENPIYFPAQRVACTPLGDGFRVAGMMEFRKPEAPLDPRRIKAIIDAARPMFTGIDWEARTDEWVGSRPCTADGLPLVGVTRSSRVFVSGGHGMWGVTLGPLSGRLLAQQIVHGVDNASALRYFSPLR